MRFLDMDYVLYLEGTSGCEPCSPWVEHSASRTMPSRQQAAGMGWRAPAGGSNDGSVPLKMIGLPMQNDDARGRGGHGCSGTTPGWMEPGRGVRAVARELLGCL